MVSHDTSAFLYLFLGQDIIAPDGSSRKEAILRSVKKNLLIPSSQDFNLDTVYAKGLELKELQKLFLQLPVKSQRRMLVIRDAQYLKPELKDFLKEQIKRAKERPVTLILDINEPDFKDEFLKNVSRYARVYRFRQTIPLNAFTLTRQIEMKNHAFALKVLSELLHNGERPERILGGLRYALEKQETRALEKRKKLKLLLNCDLEIKTGRLKSNFALEKLIIRLCSLQ